MTLPIDPLLPEIVAILSASSRLVLRADPGAGKTTRVPAALLDAGIAGDKQIVVLEPRRIAARAAAEFVAQQRRQSVGAEVGYRVRFEQRGSARTRLWFVTEGVLGRQLAHDPFLEGVGVVVLDEFHERHLQGDVALAVVRELQESVRPDLKLVVMSATLATEELAQYLDGCAALVSQGRAYPVEVSYDPMPDQRPLALRVVTAVERALSADADGDVLVFLPGAAEIRRTGEALAALAGARGIRVVALHGDLPLDAQRDAIRRGVSRRVVLSTNVAETALTVEGVTTVIDCGLAREARLDRRHGINSLQLVRISRAAAEQRAGRAGRTQPGRCFRLWTRFDHDDRRAFEVPEVRRLDLAGTLLDLRAWGLRDLGTFRWLDPPPAAALARAERLLQDLGAVDASGAVTECGRRMLAMSVHPRLARMLVEAERRRCGPLVTLVAALASERDICLEQRAFSGARSGRGSGSSDLLLRVELFEEAQRHRFDVNFCRSHELDGRSLHAVERARQQLLRVIGRVESATMDEDALLRCVLAGFPDRVVRRREPGSSRGVMVGGTGVELDAHSVVRDAELFVAVEVVAGDKRQRAEARVRIASAIRAEWLAELFPGLVRRDDQIVFDPERERVLRRQRLCFGDLVLHERLSSAEDRAQAAAVLAAAARVDPRRAAVVSEETQSLLARIAFLARALPQIEWPEPETLLADVVASACAGCVSYADLRRIDLSALLRGLLTPAQRAALERDAPAQLQLSSGRFVKIVYEADKPPHVSGRIQEFFGVVSTPRIAAGRVALVVELLAPNQRAVQITDDLESFWRRTYPEIRKVLRGRYPKHLWPEDPFSEQPTARIRRR